jgi:nucleoside-diphosphate-sugar epimerase
MTDEKIFITGATGRLGRSVLKLISDAIPIVRRPYGLPNERVTDFSADELKNIFKNAKAIIHLAGSMDFANKKILYETNVELTKKIKDSAPEKCKIILASSISVYGKKLEQIPADEETACKPDNDYAKSKLAAEHVLTNHPNSVILRIGTIYGPQFGEYMVVLKKIEQGKMLIIGDGKNRIPFVHVDDVASAIAASIEKGKGVYVLAGDALTQEEIYSIAAKELGVEPPRKRISFALSYWFAWLRTKLGKTGFGPEHISILGSDRAYVCTKAKTELGFKSRPLQDGLKQMVKHLKEL